MGSSVETPYVHLTSHWSSCNGNGSAGSELRRVTCTKSCSLLRPTALDVGLPELLLTASIKFHSDT